MATTSISIELRGLGYALDAPLVRGAVAVQRTSRRVRRVEGTAVLPSPVAGEVTVAFDLVSLPAGYHERPCGTIRVADPAAKIDLSVDVALSEARGRPVEGAGSEEGWERVLGDDVSRSWYAELTTFGDHLYTGTLATHTGLAESDAEEDPMGCRVLRSRDGVEWEVVVDDSFGNPMNNGIISMAAFDGRLYIGTSNTEGGEVHRSADGLHWERCWKGAGDPERNWHAWKLYAYAGRLYLGTASFPDCACVLEARSV